MPGRVNPATVRRILQEKLAPLVRKDLQQQRDATRQAPRASPEGGPAAVPLDQSQPGDRTR